MNQFFVNADAVHGFALAAFWASLAVFFLTHGMRSYAPNPTILLSDSTKTVVRLGVCLPLSALALVGLTFQRYWGF